MGRQLFDTLHEGSDVCPGHRVNHARGIALEGRFEASTAAAELTSAVAMQGTPVRALLRFSDSTASPRIDQSDPRADPRGAALRLTASDGSTSDFVGHSVARFPAATPAAFLDFLSALAMRAAEPDAFERYLTGHPSADRFLRAVPPMPSSYAAERYHMLHVMVLTSSSGVGTAGRITLEPMGGLSSPDGATTARGADILHYEMEARIAIAPVAMRLSFEVADVGDPTDDITTPWPEGRRRVSLGTVLLDRIAHDERDGGRTAFDPARLAPGIAPAGDPMFAVRSEVYHASKARRLAVLDLAGT